MQRLRRTHPALRGHGQARFIGLDPAGTHLYAANQRSDSIVEFAVDKTSGALSATGQVVKANTSVCVVFR